MIPRARHLSVGAPCASFCRSQCVFVFGCLVRFVCERLVFCLYVRFSVTVLVHIGARRCVFVHLWVCLCFSANVVRISGSIEEGVCACDSGWSRATVIDDEQTPKARVFQLSSLGAQCLESRTTTHASPSVSHMHQSTQRHAGSQFLNAATKRRHTLLSTKQLAIPCCCAAQAASALDVLITRAWTLMVSPTIFRRVSISQRDDHLAF